jgi:hypothetical protein
MLLKEFQHLTLFLFTAVGRRGRAKVKRRKDGVHIEEKGHA